MSFLVKMRSKRNQAKNKRKSIRLLHKKNGIIKTNNDSSARCSSVFANVSKIIAKKNAAGNKSKENNISETPKASTSQRNRRRLFDNKRKQIATNSSSKCVRKRKSNQYLQPYIFLNKTSESLDHEIEQDLSNDIEIIEKPPEIIVIEDDTILPDTTNGSKSNDKSTSKASNFSESLQKSSGNSNTHNTKTCINENELNSQNRTNFSNLNISNSSQLTEQHTTLESTQERSSFLTSHVRRLNSLVNKVAGTDISFQENNAVPIYEISAEHSRILGTNKFVPSTSNKENLNNENTNTLSKTAEFNFNQFIRKSLDGKKNEPHNSSNEKKSFTQSSEGNSSVSLKDTTILEIDESQDSKQNTSQNQDANNSRKEKNTSEINHFKDTNSHKTQSQKNELEVIYNSVENIRLNTSKQCGRSNENSKNFSTPNQSSIAATQVSKRKSNQQRRNNSSVKDVVEIVSDDSDEEQSVIFVREFPNSKATQKSLDFIPCPLGDGFQRMKTKRSRKKTTVANNMLNPFKRFRHDIQNSFATSTPKTATKTSAEITFTLSEKKKNEKYNSNTYNPNKNVDIKKSEQRMIIVDGSNVAFGHSNSNFFSTRGLEIVLEFFEEKGHPVKAVVPQFRVNHNKSSDCEKLRELHRKGKIVLTPGKNLPDLKTSSYDDRFILQLALELDAAIVSNDNFRDLIDENPGFKKIIENRVITYTWCDDLFIIAKDPYGKGGPKLDEILNRQECNKA